MHPRLTDASDNDNDGLPVILLLVFALEMVRGKIDGGESRHREGAVVRNNVDNIGGGPDRIKIVKSQQGTRNFAARREESARYEEALRKPRGWGRETT
ncbi:hypothetical protein GLOTRDRAFT_140661 [Gloeophyllum trabeum ATCC 11539]|uniref:Uncharacterized protein n=1 Tax=Gloeophyllum trabeum (strain ATCC 11539 / FP-39264 / Madison 617) TaxID=670483 RepID=S7PY46_GLOTA|nr:uncharacterized protein GLOTRDRAFT_140661 [Gloeophyllum trabeum ATCC 11539]EPQ52277.1 hypothetical protein GLOTRDRAFT_140661 [Gloeophyllum trabeum ATCC 11539]